MPNLHPMSGAARRKPGDTATDIRRSDIDDDAMQPRHDEPSREVLVSAIQAAEKGSPLEAALLWALEQRSGVHGGDGNGPRGDGVTSRLAVQLSVLLASVLGLVQPVVSQGAERVLSPTSALERKLDTVISQQAELQQAAINDHATFVALAKWVVACEIARKNGLAMPDPPPSVQLVLVKDELDRTTGP